MIPYKYLKYLLIFIMSASIAVTLPACSSSSGGDDDDDGGLGDATTVTGIALLPNGDPVSGATVYIPGAATSLTLTKSKTIAKSATATCDGAEIECADPAETSCGSTCSCSDGSFEVGASSCSSSSDTIKWCKGSICGTATLDCSSGSDTCEVNITGSASISNIAVVTGIYDEIENVLAKLGYGSVDDNGQLEVGTETFSIYRCGGSIDSELLLADPDGETYKPCGALFGDLTEMQEYDIIFINCGASEDPTGAYPASLRALIASGDINTAHAVYHSVVKSLSDDTLSNLQDYVSGGGRLYVTDLAYDYIEQSHPEFMKFNNDPDDSTTPGAQDAAREGVAFITSDATINNSGLSSWIAGSSITTNTIDSAISPNFESCETTVGGNSGSDNLNDDDTIRVGDFLGDWAVMEEAHSGVSPASFIWIEGPVTFSGPTTETRPLTVSKEVGSNGGCILYSSYHTSDQCPTTGFWPQERILQYLVFETAGSCTPD